MKLGHRLIKSSWTKVEHLVGFNDSAVPLFQLFVRFLFHSLKEFSYKYQTALSRRNWNWNGTS